MKPVLKLAFIVAFLCSSCSSDSSSNSNGTQKHDFSLKINGVNTTIPNENYSSNVVGIGLQGNVFRLTAYYGMTNNNQSSHIFELLIDKKGNLISVKNSANANPYGDFTYANYNFFPSNYFQISNFSLDETTKKIKLSFSGKLYLNGNTTTNLFLPSLDREFVEAEGEVDMNYEEWGTPYTGIYYGSFEQYCTANVNDVFWEANRSNEQVGGLYTYGTFMASDPYKIQIHFGQNASLGSYDFTNSSPGNYIAFSKFNTTTLSYDNYSVNGTLINEYKEFHGMTLYSYFGSFSFTATNVNNPADVVQVTDGKFRYSHDY